MIKRKTWNEGVSASVVQEKLPNGKLEQNQLSLIGVNYIEKTFARFICCSSELFLSKRNLLSQEEITFSTTRKR